MVFFLIIFFTFPWIRQPVQIFPKIKPNQQQQSETHDNTNIQLTVKAGWRIARHPQELAVLAGSPRRTVTVVTAGSVQTPSLQARRRGAMIFRLLKVNTQKKKTRRNVKTNSEKSLTFAPALIRICPEPNRTSVSLTTASLSGPTPSGFN